MVVPGVTLTCWQCLQCLDGTMVLQKNDKSAERGYNGQEERRRGGRRNVMKARCIKREERP